MKKRTYSFQLALSTSDITDYFDLRQQIFCEEQGLFQNHDRDSIDPTSYPIVAIAHTPDHPDQIVGVVRIYEQQPRLWYGGRLGVHPDFRRVGRIGKGLIQKAVTTANTWGCDRFLATVQLQNVRFFTRLHWQSLEEIEVLGHPHHLMEADLEHYPATDQPRPSLPLEQVA
ncbi:MSMEG_0567/Sll0786 family nitrogen starvation N-acetyltransferase [Leptothoe sp. PORK10 BA2]|uniref:MSMEG_0567/Sll0786 family nitrogen starvation N-acetyltransferase n=1 Tax=Leptothoe sp. PORK10 BA2 TaxID=3110254 RepID=UPI002B1FBB76|nr:MSMEG_0567/Sll0786 family nitrogen starvation N-acetyltransferase [Leptothoe sp. PORK10 BA2]MEA5465572.1 MSMEG_0567/Sll0786 family nitrogen starvation N-acetyltransferase [Leptothoe sp. PORK10 BA2]